MLEKERGQDRGGILASVVYFSFINSQFTSFTYRDDMGLGKPLPFSMMMLVSTKLLHLFR